MNRRKFLQNAFHSTLLSGFSGALFHGGDAAAEPLTQNMLAFLELEGGTDFRHLIVPAYDENQNSFGYLYWQNRSRSHAIDDNPAAWEARWNDDYYPITINEPGPNNGVTFGIWRQAGWLIDMYLRGNVAFICNAVGSKDRSHDHSLLILNQLNRFAPIKQVERSGMGGRLVRTIGGRVVAMTSTPSPFCYGPVGESPDYDHASVDNRDLITLQNTRQTGLYGFDSSIDQSQLVEGGNQRMARTLQAYYASLRTQPVSSLYERFRNHESKIREFGALINDRLVDEPLPEIIRALYDVGHNLNNDPDSGSPRRVLHSAGFGHQIRNLYDSILSNDLLGMRVASLQYGGWDSHGRQRRLPTSDINDPNQLLGIEAGFRDIFRGPSDEVDNSALHGGLSALWNSLNEGDRDRLVITIASEFGRQLRANRDQGTDHGEGNTMMVIGANVRGGVYGTLFPEGEIDRIQDLAINTPDITGLTDIDYIFRPVCNWVAGGNPEVGSIVIPEDESANIEFTGMLDDLFI